MKIKEVSQITGLTEKTIRFYEEKQLIHPEQTEINGRIFRNYKNQDIDLLNLVAGLRKLDFSISDIIVMQANPGRIPEILKGYQEKNTVDLEFKARVMERLQQVECSSISSIRDLGGCMKEIAEDRPLPAVDVELQFYRIDGLTREEMDREVQGYYEQLSIDHKRKFRRKITSVVVLYITTVVVTLILGLLTWRNTYYLGYIPSYQDDSGWRWILIPLYGLLIGTVSYIFVKKLRNITHKDESAVISGFRSFRTTALVLLVSLLVGVVISDRSYKSLEQVKTDAGITLMNQWYELYSMTYWVQKHYFDSREKEIGDNLGFGLYVNQTCHNFPYGNGDRLRTRIRDLLIWSYDLIFKELQYTNSKTSPERKEQLEKMLEDINQELMQISGEIVYKSIPELAELTRYDNKDGDELRSRIIALVDKYTKETTK